MANPQKEQGHLDIANKIVEQLAKLSLHDIQWRILWVVWRKTWCWHKKSDWISYGQICKFIGIENKYRGWIIKETKDLFNRNIINKEVVKRKVIIGFQKDYDLWVVSPHIPPNTGKSTYTKVVSPHIPEVVSPHIHTKETKETIQKKLSSSKNKKPYCAFNNLPMWLDEKNNKWWVINGVDDFSPFTGDIIKDIYYK